MKHIFALILLALGSSQLRADFIYFHFNPAGSIGTLANQLQLQNLPVDYMTRDLLPLSTRLNMPPGALQVTTGPLNAMSLFQAGGFVFAASLDYLIAGGTADLTGPAIIPGGGMLTPGPIFTGAAFTAPATLTFAPGVPCLVGATCAGEFAFTAPLSVAMGTLNPLVNSYMNHQNHLVASTGILTVQFLGDLNTSTAEVTGTAVTSIDFSLAAAVPEPGTRTILGAAIMGGAMLACRRRTQKENRSDV